MVESVYDDAGDPKKKVQVAVPVGWVADYPSPFNFFGLSLSCATSHSTTYANNYARFCDRRIDAEVRRASSLQANDPQAAAALWRKIDQDVVAQAPWLVFGNRRGIDFVSRRVGNYVNNPQWRALLDQMWVR